MAKQEKLTVRQSLGALFEVAKLSFSIAPGAVTFKLFGSLINAILPIVTTYFAARTTTELVQAYGGSTAAKHAVILYVVLTIIFGLVTTAWNSIDNYVQNRMRYLVELRVSNRMYERFLSLEFWRYEDKDTLDVYDRATKFSFFFAYIFNSLSNLVSDIIAVASAVIALAIFNVGIALFVLAALFPGMYVQWRLSKRQARNWRETTDVRREIGVLEWILSYPRYIAEIRLYGLVRSLLDRRSELKDTDELKRVEIQKDVIPRQLFADAVQSVAELVTLIWVVLQIVARKAPIGQFVYVQQLVSRAINSANGFINTIGSMEEDIANLFDYDRFMRFPLMVSGDVEVQNVPEKIIIDDVSFRYPGADSDVLKNVSLTIERSQHVAIVGENGAGKSTLIKLITGLYAPTSGSIRLDDINLTNVDVVSWHKYLGFLQQSFAYYDFTTVLDNVRFGDVGSEYSEARLEQALRDAEAYEFVSKLPKQAKTPLNKSVHEDGVDLSGGQWQRLALARNFYRNSPIVILDEPTSAIDALAEARIFDRLFKGKKRTVITISHRLSTIKKADVIYMLKDGEIVESGTHNELIAKKGEFYHMFKSQIEG